MFAVSCSVLSKCVLACGLSIVLGLFIHFVDPYDIVFRWKIRFAEGGEIFEIWKEPPVDLFLKVHIFNVTNADGYMSGIEPKLKFNVVGPYVYRELIGHENITFNDNGTLLSRPQHPLEFQAHLSNGLKEEDIFMVPNVAFFAIGQIAAEYSYFTRLPLNVYIRNKNIKPIIKLTAREYMFDYESPLVTLGNTFLPNWIDFDKVGIVDRMYNFKSDYATFYTGESDLRLTGQYDTYLGSKHLTQWNGDFCSNIQTASEGIKFKSLVETNETLLFFRKSVCRALPIVPIKEVTFTGIKTMKYVFEENALDNGAIDERNKCYCREGTCLPKGLIDVNACYYGFPIALSYPHFLDADPAVYDKIEGISPNRDEHSSYFMIEPKTGFPHEFSVKLQINLFLTDLSGIANTKGFSNSIIPTVWCEIILPGISWSLKARLLFYVNFASGLQATLYYGSFVFAVSSFFFVVYLATLLRRTKEKSLHKTREKAEASKEKLVSSNDVIMRSYTHFKMPYLVERLFFAEKNNLLENVSIK